MRLELIKQDTPELIFDDAVYPLNQDAIAEWSAYREEDLKKPLTPRALRMVSKKLTQWSELEQMRIVEASIENNWMGIHYTAPPKARTTRERSLVEDLTDTGWAQ